METPSAPRKITALITLALLAAGLWECGLGWAQLTGFAASHNARYAATGTFYNPGPYCAYLAMLLPVALGCCLDSRRKLLHWAGIIYLTTAAAIMPSLMGRTGWVAAAVGCLLTAAGCGVVRRPRPGAIVAAVLAAVAAGALLFWLKPASALGRLFLWRTGLSAALQRPLTGVGWDYVAGALGNAQEAYFHACPDSAFAAVAGTPEYAFNEFLQVGIAFGLPAMLLFAVALAAGVVAAWRGGAFGIAGGVVAFAVGCVSSYPLQFPVSVATAGLLLVGATVAAPWGGRAVKGAAIAALAGIVALACVALERRSAQAESWTGMSYMCRYGLDSGRIAQLDSLAADYGRSARFLFDYGKALRSAGLYEKSTQVLRRGVQVSADPMFLNVIGRNCHDLGHYEEAARWYGRSIDRLPGRLYPYYLLGRLYADPAVSDPAAFRAVAEKAATMEPKVMSPAVRQIREELAHLADSIAASAASFEAGRADGLAVDGGGD